ncbi:uncharacterized protein T551_00091 [Pneumocystis jirovecii RU7]|uniref:Redoxin domain-containing protein n=1 Tax=Pneumocystis jirovecii (strain RU7) TaxID=1408657 RepID=A0A0W4ZW72_PNEJ7|nr:uncharacterized protein T551_00091 [Pneumocystis jirovecii RU7]KTW32606.1 hypothetical protein T551_00091 [Pneumocystis jirovecii RU7]
MAYGSAVSVYTDPVRAWGDSYNARNKIVINLFLTDTDANFSRSLGWDLDLTAYGLGIRTHRYALVVQDGIVTYTGLEPDPGAVTVSGAQAVLAAL